MAAPGVDVVHYWGKTGSQGPYSMAVQLNVEGAIKVLGAGHAPNVPLDAGTEEGYPIISLTKRGQKYSGDISDETDIVLANIRRTFTAIARRNEVTFDPKVFDHALIFANSPAEAKVAVNRWRHFVGKASAEVSVVITKALPGMKVEIIPCSTFPLLTKRR